MKTSIYIINSFITSITVMLSICLIIIWLCLLLIKPSMIMKTVIFFDEFTQQIGIYIIISFLLMNSLFLLMTN